jgi:hypothetical protein
MHLKYVVLFCKCIVFVEILKITIMEHMHLKYLSIFNYSKYLSILLVTRISNTYWYFVKLMHLHPKVDISLFIGESCCHFRYHNCFRCLWLILLYKSLYLLCHWNHVKIWYMEYNSFGQESNITQMFVVWCTGQIMHNCFRKGISKWNKYLVSGWFEIWNKVLSSKICVVECCQVFNGVYTQKVEDNKFLLFAYQQSWYSIFF